MIETLGGLKYFGIVRLAASVWRAKSEDLHIYRFFFIHFVIMPSICCLDGVQTLLNYFVIVAFSWSLTMLLLFTSLRRGFPLPDPRLFLLLFSFFNIHECQNQLARTSTNFTRQSSNPTTFG